MEKPDVDSIEGLSPAISIEQKTTSRNPRSTVAHHHRDLRLPAPAVRARRPRRSATTAGAKSRSRACSRSSIASWRWPEGTRMHVLAPIVRDRKGEYRKELSDLRRAGFVRVEGRRQGARAGRRDRAQQEPAPYDRGDGRSPRDSPRDRKTPERLAGSRLQVRAGPAQDRAARRQGRRRGLLQPALRLRGMRHLVSGDHAADVFLQQSAWRVHRPARESARLCTSIPSWWCRTRT